LLCLSLHRQARRVRLDDILVGFSRADRVASALLTLLPGISHSKELGQPEQESPFLVVCARRGVVVRLDSLRYGTPALYSVFGDCARVAGDARRFLFRHLPAAERGHSFVDVLDDAGARTAPADEVGDARYGNRRAIVFLASVRAAGRRAGSR